MTTTTTAVPATGTVGASYTRVEGLAKVTGAARYAGDVPAAELAHGWLVLSTVARGRIRSIESDPVRAMPGVLAVLHHGNAPRVDGNYVGMLGRPDPIVEVFQHDRVPFVGWPVALVVAETSEQAREAAEALVVRYDEEPHDVAFSAGHAGDLHTGRRRHAGGEGRPRGRTRRVRPCRGRGVHHPGRAPQLDGTARGDGALGRRTPRGLRLQPGQHVGGAGAGETVLARPGLGAGAVRAHRRCLRVQGCARAPDPRRDGGDRTRPPGPGRHDATSDVLARRLPQPHGPARQARRRRRRAVACARPPGAQPHVDGPRIRRGQRRVRASDVCRRRSPQRQPGGAPGRADADLHARAR